MTARPRELDRIETDLRAAYTRYLRLTGELPRGRTGTGRTLPGSTDPLRVAHLDHLAILERYLRWWTAAANAILDPNPIWEIDWPCPYCTQTTLTGYPNQERIDCDNPDCQDDQGDRRSWTGRTGWTLLGNMIEANYPDAMTEARTATPVHKRRRRGARPPWAQLNEILGTNREAL